MNAIQLLLKLVFTADFWIFGFLTTFYLSQIITHIVYYNYLNKAVSD